MTVERVITVSIDRKEGVKIALKKDQIEFEKKFQLKLGFRPIFLGKFKKLVWCIGFPRWDLREY